MPALNLWLIRHGECLSNTGVTSARPHESALTAKGKLQAVEVARHIVHKPDLLVISMAKRSQDTALPIIERWPDVETQIWPIQELVYLNPSEYHRYTPAERKYAVQAYWQRNDPEFFSGEGAESFADFIARIDYFHQAVKNQKGYVVVVGHGMFFLAYQLCLQHGFVATNQLMKLFRQRDTNNQINNGEIIRFD
jgi:broad specificity phosphatase PhoE